jgi:hypothetical protein
MKLPKTLPRILFTGFAFAVLPLGAAGAAESSTKSAERQTRSLPVVEHDKTKANRLARDVKKSTDYKKAVRRVSKTKAASDEAARVADELSRFYAATPAQREKFWNATLDAAVEAKLLTARDRTVLKRAYKSPHATLTTWKPATELGIELRKQYLQTNQGEEEAQHSTAGDVGTIMGGIVGGIIGSWTGAAMPMAVGIGAAVGKVAGEAVNTYSNWDSGDGDDTVDGDEGGESDAD